MWHREGLSTLQYPQQVTSFEPGYRRKRGRFYFSMQPYERLVLCAHMTYDMSNMTYTQEGLANGGQSNIHMRMVVA